MDFFGYRPVKNIMKKFIILAGVCLAVLAALFPVWNKWQGPASAEKKIALAKKNEALIRRKSAWMDLKKGLAAEMRGYNGVVSFVVKDLDMNWEINTSPNASIPSASIVKIPIMMAYFYAEHEKKIDFNFTVKLSNYPRTSGSGVLKNMPSGQHVTIRELIELMITHSDNMATNILIDIFGMEKMNEYFLKLGLRHTNLSRKMMDFKSRKRGVENFTTSHDMAHLLEKLYRGDFISADVSRRCLEVLAGQKINDRIPKRLPTGTTVAHKTGLEKGLCHDVGIVYTKKGNFLISVLAKHDYKYAQPTKKLISRISLLAYEYYDHF